ASVPSRNVLPGWTGAPSAASPLGKECSGLRGASSGAKTAMTARPTTTSSEISATGSWQAGQGPAGQVRLGDRGGLGAGLEPGLEPGLGRVLRGCDGRVGQVLIERGGHEVVTSEPEGVAGAGAAPGSSGATWQAASWPPALGRSSGRTVRQRSMAAGHRGWNGQPGGGLAGSGGSPVSLARADAAPADTSGTAAIRAWV